MRPPHIGWLLVLMLALAFLLGALMAGADHRWAARLGAQSVCGTVALDYSKLQARYDSMIRAWEGPLRGPRHK